MFKLSFWTSACPEWGDGVVWKFSVLNIPISPSSSPLGTPAMKSFETPRAMALENASLSPTAWRPSWKLCKRFFTRAFHSYSETVCFCPFFFRDSPRACTRGHQSPELFEGKRSRKGTGVRPSLDLHICGGAGARPCNAMGPPIDAHCTNRVLAVCASPSLIEHRGTSSSGSLLRGRPGGRLSESKGA